jgi:FkbM family methyltransferase
LHNGRIHDLAVATLEGVIELHIREFVRLHNLIPSGVLHVGAHEAEEVGEYIANGFAKSAPIIWVEAQTHLAENLRNRLDSKENKVYCAVAWDVDGETKTFNITSKSASSSLFDLDEHKNQYPEIDIVQKIEVTTSRLDTILSNSDVFDFVVLDIQGAESQAIKGLGKRIDSVKWIFTEISKKELYAGATLYKDLDTQLSNLGFRRVFTAWDRRAGWGDALYARSSTYKVSLRQILLIQLSRILRFGRSYIPNGAFPALVKIKQLMRVFL